MCKDDFNGKDGVRTSYFEGSKKISQTVEYKNGLRNGWLTEYYDNGSLMKKSWYLNDTLQDTTMYFYKNGTMSDLQLFKKGRKEGCWKRFNEEGHCYQEANFKDNHKEGVQLMYTYRSGRLLERSNYKDGWKDGRQEVFYNSGKKKSVCYFNTNRPCKGLEEWYESGKKVDNDFSISIKEKDRLMMESKITYVISFEHPQANDEVRDVLEGESLECMFTGMTWHHTENHFERDFYIYKGGFVMQKVTIAAFRKTYFGNTFIKTATFNVSATHF